MTDEAGPSSFPSADRPNRPVVPSVLRNHFAAYQRSTSCSSSSAYFSLHRPRTPTHIAPSIFEGWLGSSGKGTAQSHSAGREATREYAEEAPPTQLSNLVGGATTQTVSAPDQASTEWQDHPETAQERKQRERCESWSQSLFKSSPMIRFMARHLILVSCDPLASPTSSTDFPRLTIAPCPPTIAGGFSPSAPGQPVDQSGILICSNRMMSKSHMEDTLAHEMIHWWDHCRFKVDWTDLRQHACSEIRAASLSGDCRFSRETGRRIWGLTKQHQTCTRRRAVLSVMANGNCKGGKEEAERVVDQVWNSCFSDTRPFDEIY